MALKGVNQGLAGFAQFGQQQLKNKGQRILNEGAQMELDTKQANQNLALMETFGVVKLNKDTARYELTDNFYEAYQKIPEGERGAIFNGDSLFGAYTDKDGKKKIGELGSAITVDKKVPTSMKDEKGNPTEEGKKFLASGQKGIIIPTKREDGMFSFLTRNRSADESDDEGIVLSPAEFGGLMEFRANKLNVLSDANRARAGNLASQQAETLQGQGMGSSDITTDDQSQSPEALAFAVRGFQLVEDLVVDIPVNISDQIERPNRKRLRVNGQGDLIYQALRNKEGKNVQLEIFRPDTLLRGIIENVSAPVEEISARGSVTVFCLVRFRGSKIFTVSSASTTLGTGLLGVERLG